MVFSQLDSYVEDKNGDIFKFDKILYDKNSPISDLLPTRNILNQQYEKAYKAKNNKKMYEIQIKLDEINKLIDPYVKKISKYQYNKEMDKTRYTSYDIPINPKIKRAKNKFWNEAPLEERVRGLTMDFSNKKDRRLDSALHSLGRGINILDVAKTLSLL
jgi:hypothetical protein